MFCSQTTVAEVSVSRQYLFYLCDLAVGHHLLIAKIPTVCDIDVDMMSSSTIAEVLTPVIVSNEDVAPYPTI